jgi:hypothetical protein
VLKVHEKGRGEGREAGARREGIERAYPSVNNDHDRV